MTKRKDPIAIDLACKNCGTPFRSPFKRRGRHKGFCSEECREAAASTRARKYYGERRSTARADLAIGDLFEGKG